MALILKDLVRTIKNSLGRFLAIAGICALGVGFFAGLQMTCGDMKQALTSFYNNTNFMDIRIVSTLGFSDENIDAIKNVDGVDGVMPAYETDILTNFGSEQTVIRLHSLPDSATDSKYPFGKEIQSNDNNYINRQYLESGDWPKNAGECLLSADIPSVNMPKIGDTIQIFECSSNIDTTLSVHELKVVGFVHSSYYVGIVQMGPSNLGKGIINNYAYVPNNTFADDFPYSEAFVSVANSDNFVTASDDYQDFVDGVAQKIKDIAPAQSEIRTSSIKNSAQSKLDEAKAEFEKQKAEALSQLNDQEEKLNSAWKEIQSSQTPLLQAQALLDANYNEFNANKAAVLNPINEGIAQLQTLINNFSKLQNKFCANYEDIAQSSILVNNQATAPQALDAILSQLSAKIEIDNALIAAFSAIPETPELVITIVNNDITAANQLKDFSTQFKEDIVAHPENYETDLATFNALYGQISIYSNALKNVLPEIGKKLNASLDELEAAKQKATNTFNELEKPLIDATIQLNSSKTQLESGIAEYYSGLKLFSDAKAKALSEFASAQNTLDEKQQDIDGIEDAKFYIMDRSKNFGAANFNNDADRIASIANVFPLMFFFVALLVALTSMTRMVEEERIAIGTYKALGFSKFKISQKYVLYGLISSLIGSVVGVVILAQFLPWVIMFAYAIIYKLYIPFPMPINAGIATLSVALGCGTTLLATLLAAVKSLNIVPSQLMIPTAPKAGKRIFLEHIKPVWTMLNFNWKITFRNMFLYKRRLIMTIVGIAGCCALLMTGFGLHDSINDIMTMQFDKLTFDTFQLTLDSSYSQEDVKKIESIINDYDQGAQNLLTHEENMIAQPQGYPDQSVIIMIGQDTDSFENLRLIRNRTTGQSYHLKDGEIFISEKLATLLGIDVGDNITLYNQDLIGNAGSEKYSLTITGVFENYIAHFLYMTPKTYEDNFKKPCTFGVFHSNCDIPKNNEDEFLSRIQQVSTVKSAYFTDTNRQTYNKMLGSVNLVVVILIVAAGILAFVVLYNLININICERAREIATLKVLGCRPSEINFYIHRETFLLSALGCIAGVLFGFVLEAFVIQSAEVDYVMFGRNIYWWSILFSVGITMFFTIFVALFMRKKLFGISMVESLKSVE